MDSPDSAPEYPISEAHPSRLDVAEAALRLAGAGRLALVLLVLAAPASLLLASGLPMAAAAIVFIGWLTIRLGTRDTWRAAADEADRRPVELPAASTVADPAAKLLLRRLTVARAQFDLLLTNSSSGERLSDSHVKAVRRLERAAVHLLRRIEYFSAATYALPATLGAADEEAELMGLGAHTPAFDIHGHAGETDGQHDVGRHGGRGAGGGMTSGAESLRERISKLEDARRSVIQSLEQRRIADLKRLSYVTATLESLPTDMMELRILKHDSLDRCLPDPVADADTLREDLRQLREGLAEPSPVQ